MTPAVYCQIQAGIPAVEDSRMLSLSRTGDRWSWTMLGALHRMTLAVDFLTSMMTTVLVEFQLYILQNFKPELRSHQRETLTERLLKKRLKSTHP